MERGDRLNSLGQELKSVVIGSKNGCPLSTLSRDYKTLVGKHIPFRDLGFPDLESLLKQMPKYIRLSRGPGGESIAFAVSDASTDHIANLVARQKSPKRRTAIKPRRNMGGYRPRSPTFRKTFNHTPRPYQQYNQPARSNAAMYHRVVPPVSKAPLQNKTNQSYGYKNEAPAPSARPQAKRAYNVPPRFANLKSKPNENQPFVERKVDAGVSYTARELPKYDFVESVNSEMAAASLNRNTKDCAIPNYGGIKDFTVTTDGTKRLINAKTKMVETLPNPQVDSSGPADCKGDLGWSEGWDHSDRVISPELPSTPVAKIPKTSIELVEVYAQQRGFQVFYKTVPIKNKKSRVSTYLSTLTIQEEKYLSYPDEMPTPEEANELAAAQAVAKLKLTPESVYVTLSETRAYSEAEIEALVNRITEIVTPKVNGVWHMNVKRIYEETHQESLPKGWLSLLKARTKIKIDSVGQRELTDRAKYILYPASQNAGRDSPGNLSCITTSSEHRSVSLDGSSSSGLPDPIRLPEGNLDVIIKTVNSSVEIYFNLVENVDVLRNLSLEMNEFYERNECRVNDVIVGETYAYFSQETWERVRVLERLGNQTQVVLFFLDHGDSEIADIQDLNELKKQFLETPFQAIPCELTALDYFCIDEELTDRLSEMILGKILIAVPTPKDEGISLVLYDTSTDVDININDEMLKYVYKELMLPKLPEIGATCFAYLSHVQDNGDLMLRLASGPTEIITQIFSDIEAKLEEQRGYVTQVDVVKLYAVKYSDGTWRRALLLDGQLKDNKVTVSLMDYGTTYRTAIQDLCELDRHSELLVNLPFQTITCRLSNVTMDDSKPWTTSAIKRLQDLAPSDTQLYLKPMTDLTSDRLPTVELFKWNDRRELISINQTMASECFLFGESPEKFVSSKKRPTTIKFRAPRAVFPSAAQTSPIFSPSPLTPLTEVKADPPLFSPSLIPLSSVPNGSQASQLSSSSQFAELVGNRIGAPVIPNIGAQYDVNVCYAPNPELMIVQDLRVIHKLDEIMDDINTFYNSEENLLEMDPCLLIPGNFFAVKHSTNQKWYRGLLERNNPLTVVYLIDFGEFLCVDIDRLQPLYKRFCELSAQAIRATLVGVKPFNGKNWPTDDATFYQSLVMGKNFVSIIKTSEYDESKGPMKGHMLGLSLIDTSTADDVFIDNLLIEKNIARRVD